MSQHPPKLPQTNPTRLTKSHNPLQDSHRSSPHTSSSASPSPSPFLAFPSSSIDIAQLAICPSALFALIAQRESRKGQHV